MSDAATNTCYSTPEEAYTLDHILSQDLIDKVNIVKKVFLTLAIVAGLLHVAIFPTILALKKFSTFVNYCLSSLSCSDFILSVVIPLLELLEQNLGSDSVGMPKARQLLLVLANVTSLFTMTMMSIAVVICTMSPDTEVWSVFALILCFIVYCLGGLLGVVTSQPNSPCFVSLGELLVNTESLVILWLPLGVTLICGIVFASAAIFGGQELKLVSCKDIEERKVDILSSGYRLFAVYLSFFLVYAVLAAASTWAYLENVITSQAFNVAFDGVLSFFCCFRGFSAIILAYSSKDLYSMTLGSIADMFCGLSGKNVVHPMSELENKPSTSHDEDGDEHNLTDIEISETNGCCGCLLGGSSSPWSIQGSMADLRAFEDA